MNNSTKVYEILERIKQSCPSKLQIIADFDWTLSNFDHHELSRNPTTFGKTFECLKFYLKNKNFNRYTSKQ